MISNHAFVDDNKRIGMYIMLMFLELNGVKVIASDQDVIDATWRGKFGGEIYKRSGSHGCVNLPLSAAKHIYEKVEKNFPVVTYW